MPDIPPPKAGFKNVSLVLMGLGLGLGSGLILLAHPLFALGAWDDGQPMGIGLSAAAGLCLLGLSFLCLPSSPYGRLARRSLSHPLALAALALAGWSLLASPFADHPMRSLLGPAETAQGALWYLDLAAFTAAAMVLRHKGRIWNAMLAVAALSSAIAAILGLQGIDWLAPMLSWLPLPHASRLLGFNEYLAYDALALLALAMTAGRRRGIALGLLAVVVLLISRNRTAFLIFPLVLPACFLIRWKLSWPLMIAAVLLAGLLPLGVETWGNIELLWSRGLILQSLTPALGSFFGHGWGAVPDELLRHLPSSGLQLYETHWGGIDRDMFHSHNAILEGLLSAGPIGALLAALLPLATPLSPRPRLTWIAAAFALCWAGLDGFWFMVPANLPLLTMGAAALSSRSSWLRLKIAPVPTAVAVATAGLACLGLAVMLGLQAFQESRLAHCLAAPDCAAPVLPLDLEGGDHGLATLLSAAIKQGIEAGDQLSPTHAASLRAAQQLAEQSRDSSPILSMALLNATAWEAFAPEASPLAWSDDEALSANWERDERRLLAQAPKRLDALAPYLNWLLARKRFAQLATMVELARSIEPEHPVTLWFEGTLLLQEDMPQRQALGLQRLRQAISGGIEQFMPVGPGIKASLQVQ